MGNIMSGLLHISSALIEKPEYLTAKKKQSTAEELTNCKKSRNNAGNSTSLDKIINLGMPHIGEHIFKSIDTPGLTKCLEVSETWQELAENVLIKRWKGKMLEACRNGETKVVQLLLERCTSEESGLNFKYRYGATALMWGCQNGHKDVVQLLLDHSERIELNARNNGGNTALMFACIHGYKDVVNLLLDISERIELNARNNFGMTAFMWACKKGHKDVVNFFLDHSERIDLNDKDVLGRTALMIANQEGHQDIVQLISAKLNL